MPNIFDLMCDNCCRKLNKIIESDFDGIEYRVCSEQCEEEFIKKLKEKGSAK